MTPEKTKKVLAYYLEVLDRAGVTPRQLGSDSYDQLFEQLPLVTQCVAVHHAAWMCQVATQFVEEGRMEKAMRWLGWINCTMWMNNLLTLNQVKEACAPEAEAHEP